MISSQFIKLVKNFGIIMISLFVIIAMLFNSNIIAKAQVVETPTPDEISTETEIPSSEDTSPEEATEEFTPATELVTETVESPNQISEPAITEEPVQEATPEPTDNLPNLQPAIPEGWDAPVIISTQEGSHTTDTLTVGEEVFIDLAVYNNGSDIDTLFTICLSIDDEQIQCWDVISLSAGEYFVVEDWSMISEYGEGSHHIELIIDTNNSIDETDETDNLWENDFTWLSTELETQSTDDAFDNIETLSTDVNYSSDVTLSEVTQAGLTNVCNIDDSYYEMYQYTAPSSGVYVLSAYGSNFSPNLSVMRYVNKDYKTIVCGDTNKSSEETSELAFNAQKGVKYIIKVSSKTSSGSLSLGISKINCPSGYLCGAAIGGDSRTIHYPSMKIISGTSQVGNGYGEYSGLIYGNVTSSKKGSYKIVTYGSGSLIINNSVAVPGTYSPSAVGYPVTSINVLNTSGSEIATDNIAVVLDSNTKVGGFLDGTEIGSPLKLYAPAGTYSLSAANDTTGLTVYQPNVTIKSSTNPGSVTLDASALSQDTFTFDLDGISTSNVYIYRPDRYSHSMTVNGDRTVTFAAPADTKIPRVEMVFSTDDTEGLEWDYDVILLNEGVYSTIIQGNTDHPYQVGGTFAVNPNIKDDPIRLDEAYAYIYPGAIDTYNNEVYEIYTYDENYSESSLSIESTDDPLQSFVDRTTIELTNDETLYRGIDNEDKIVTLGSAYEEKVPEYTVHDANNDWVETATVTFTTDPSYFYIHSTDPNGTWKTDESLNVGPFGGVITGQTEFEVYRLGDYPLANDDFTNAVVITELLSSSFTTDPAINTMGGTTANDDPKIPSLASKGYASAWFKYVAEHDGLLSIDTSGSDYDTVLSVWTGSRGKLVNKGYNDDYDDGTETHYTYSSIDLGVTSGTTYYIEVTQYASSTDENINVQSTDDNPKISSDLESQQIGGNLTLHASLVPCYSLSVTPNNSKYGKVSVLPKGNCLNTKYSSGTSITLSTTPKTNYGFVNWSDSTTDNPYTFSITANTVLKANFAAIAAPKLITPTNGKRTNDQTTTFSWNSVTYGSAYEIQIDNSSKFTSPLELTSTDSDLTFTVPDGSGLAEATHFWRVRALNSRGETGAWSKTYTLIIDITPPAAPSLAAPKANVIVRGTPKYTWSVPKQAKSFIFQYGTNADCSTDLVYTSGTLTKSNFTPPLQNPGTYYWCVQAWDAAGNNSSFTTGRKITILPVIPAAPALTSPISGGWVNSSQPTFTWKSVPYGDIYQIQISKVSTFKTTEKDITLSSGVLTYIPDEVLPDGTYYWRVRVTNINSENGKWSGYRIVKIDTVAQAVPVLKSPVDDSIVLTNRPTLSVKSLVSGAKYIQFQVSASDDFTSPLVDAKVTANSFKVPILPYGTYFWRAQSVDAASNESGWTETLSYSTTILKTPVDLSSTTDTTPKFTWAAESGAKKYRIQVSTTPDFSTYNQYEVSSKSLNYTPSKVLTTGTTYYWRMQVKTSSGWASYWTPYYTFTITE